MSLINDALKRANQAHKDQGSQNAAGPAMQPTQTPQKSKMPVVITLVVSLVAIIGLSAWLFLGGNKQRPVTAQVPQTRAVANLTNGVTKKPAPITPTPAVQVVTQAVTVQLATHAVAQATNSIPTTRTPAPKAFSPPPVVASQPVQSVPSAPTVGPFPTLTLKGIIYNLTSPQVLINGSYLTLGEEIEGARIIKIERTRVTVKWNGQTKELAPE
jgi:hypothetical protein